MIGRLTGQVVGEEPDGALVVDVGGVGYDVNAPLGTVGRSQRGADGTIVLHVHTHVREDALDLYGFASLLERSVFRLLLSVQNVGPRTALGVLSALPPEELAQAVADGDLARLSRVPGIGKKTAERIVLELREKLPRGRVQAMSSAVTAADASAKLIPALTGMGWRQTDAERAVAALGERVRGEPLAELLREAVTWLNDRRA